MLNSRALKLGLFSLLASSVIVLPGNATDPVVTTTTTSVTQTQASPAQKPAAGTNIAPAASVDTSTTGTTPSVTVTSTTGAPVALTAADLLSVSYQPGQSKGHYQGVRYSLKNNKDNHLQILHAEVINSVDPAQVIAEEQQKSQNRKRIAGGLMRGLASTPFSFGGLGSIGAYRAAAVGVQAVNTATYAMENTTGTVIPGMEGTYMRQVDSVVISPRDVYSFSSLVPVGTKPMIKMVFKNIETNQVYDIAQ